MREESRGCHFADELKFRENMRREQEFNLNYLHIERVNLNKWVQMELSLA